MTSKELVKSIYPDARINHWGHFGYYVYVVLEEPDETLYLGPDWYPTSKRRGMLLGKQFNIKW